MLVPDDAGVRPKINAQGEAAADFEVWAGKDQTAARGLEGVLNLFGIESPGLTSSLAVADAAVAGLRLD